MNWFQENKFAGALLGTTAVVSGVLVFFGMSFRSGAAAARGDELVAVKKIDNLRADKTYPDADNEEALKKNLIAFASEAKEFQSQILEFRPEKFEKISPGAFNSEVSKYFKKLNNLYSSKKIGFKSKGKQHFGMGSYAGPMANQANTAYLSYQREALEWLFIELANSGIASLDHVYRDPVAEVLGGGKPREEKSKERRSNRRNKTQAEMKVANSLPIEISFTGTEANMQDFLTKVASSEQYFFKLNLLKILNEKRNPISIKESSFAPVVEAAEGEISSDFGDLGFESFGGADESTSSTEDTIIKQVAGNEMITAFVKLDLQLFSKASDVVIPIVEKASKSTSTK